MALATRALLTTRVHEVFAIAHDLATIHGREEVAPVHLALAMLQERINIPAQLIAYGYQLPLDLLRRELEAHLPASADPGPTGRNHSWSASDEQILALAGVESRELGTEYLGCEHILLAFLRDSTTTPAAVLARHGIRFDDFREKVMRVYGGTMDWAEPDITTGRLHLRPISAADFTAHARIVSDPDVMQFIHAGPLNRAEAWWNIARYVGHWQLRGYGMFGVVERASGDLIGHMGFLNPEGGRGFELGWALARSSWGKGYALEGTRAAVAHAFTALRQEHITCVIRAENVRSIRIAERLGARFESEIVEAGKHLLIYGIVPGAPVAA